VYRLYAVVRGKKYYQRRTYPLRHASLLFVTENSAEKVDFNYIKAVGSHNNSWRFSIGRGLLKLNSSYRWTYCIHYYFYIFDNTSVQNSFYLQ